MHGTTRLACVGDGSAGEADCDAANVRVFVAELCSRPAAPSGPWNGAALSPPGASGSAVLEGVRPIDVVDSANREGSGIAGVTDYLRQGGSVHVNLGVGRNVDAGALGVGSADRHIVFNDVVAQRHGTGGHVHAASIGVET